METSVREPRADKVAVVDEVKGRFAAASAAILTEYRGLSVTDLQTLRRSLADAGGEYKVYKNTLVKRAITANGLDVLEPLLTGPTAIAFVESDVSGVAKVLRDFSRTNPNLVIKGGLIGTDLLDARATSALAELPSRDVLLARIAGGLAAPLQGFAALLAALPQRFAYGLSALIATKPAEETAASQAPAEPAAPDAPAASDAPAEVVAEAGPAAEVAEAGEASTEAVAGSPEAQASSSDAEASVADEAAAETDEQP